MRMNRHRRAPRGSNKVQCDLTGMVYYSPSVVKQWNNLFVGRDVYEPRNPQDLPIYTRERNMVGIRPLIPSVNPEPNEPPFSYGYDEGYES